MATAALNYRVYILLAGNAGIGKTTLAAHASNGVIDTTGNVPFPTVSSDLLRIEPLRLLLHDGVTAVVAQPWLIDMPGSVRLSTTLMPSQARGAHAFLLMFDVTDRASFLALRDYWWPAIQDHQKNLAVVTVIGNKADLEAKRVVSTADARAFAHSIGAHHYFECSALHWGHDQVITPVTHATAIVVEALHAQRKKGGSRGAATSSFALTAEAKQSVATSTGSSGGCCSGGT
jgi:GTPase SAR1 family protein